MPSIPVTIAGAELPASFIEDMREILRPMALAIAESELEYARTTTHSPLLGPLSPQQQAEAVDLAQSVIDSGGRYGWTWWKVTTRDGIGYEYSVSHPSEPNHELFEGAASASFKLTAGASDMTATHAISVQMNGGYLEAHMHAPEEDVRELAAKLRATLEGYIVEAPPAATLPFKVFIAYGGGPAWEVVRNYLNAVDVTVDAFTESERVGEVTIDVVSGMIRTSAAAIIVMTAADQMHDGTWHPRQNVVHEAGFAHGVLGIRDTIILLEEGVALPSNLANVTHIPFPRGAVHTTEARVVARVREIKADWDAGNSSPRSFGF